MSLRLSVYVNNYLARSENYVFQQVRGLGEIAATQVIARRGLNLGEFPTPNLFLEEEHRALAGLLRMRIRPRLARRKEDPYRLPSGVANRLARQTARWRPDCLYAVFAWNGMHLLDIRSRLRRRAPLVVMAGGSDITVAESLGASYLIRLRELFDACDVLLAPSAFLKEKMIRLGAMPRKIKLHYIGVKVPASLPPPESEVKKQARLLIASRLDPVKGVIHSLRSVARAAPHIGSFRLVVLGDGPEMGRCQDLARDLGIGNSVEFRGMVPHSDVLREMEISDILIQHNVKTEDGREECLGLSIVEAMVRATTPIVTRSGGVPEVVKNRETGILVESADEVAMSEAIVALVNDSVRCTTMARAARDDVKRRFNLETQNQALGRLLSQVTHVDREMTGEKRLHER